MIHLRPVLIHGSLVSIPIAPQTIHQLVGLLAKSSQVPDAPILAELQKLMEVDPLWTIWSVIRAPYWTNRIPESLDEIVIQASRTIHDLGEDLFHQATFQDLSSGSEPVGHFAAKLLTKCLGARSADNLAGASEATRSAAHCYVLFQDLPNVWRQCSPCLSCPADSGLPAHSWMLDQTEFQRRINEWPEPLRPKLPFGDGETANDDGSISQANAEMVDRCRRHFSECSNLWESHLPLLIRSAAKLSRLQTSYRQELERDKLSAMAELAYGAGHEINNPLANIASRAQTLLQDETDPERRRKLATINSQVFRAHEMIADLMLFAKPPAPQKTLINVLATIDTVVDEIRGIAEDQGTLIQRGAFLGDPLIRADATQIAVAIRALLSNSIHAMRGSGTIRIEVRSHVPEEVPSIESELGVTEWLEIEVTDDGPGIPPEVRPHIFDPYFSGREAGRGLGLGLSKCWRIVTQHGGSIELSSESNVSTTFTIRLPRERT